MAKKELRDGHLYVYCDEDGNWYPKYKKNNQGYTMELDEKYFVYVLEGYTIDGSIQAVAELDEEEADIILTFAYGLAREKYLKENKFATYASMEFNNTLQEHLYTIERQAQEMEDRLVEQYKKLEGVTEELKMKDQMEWVGRYNNILHRVRNIVQEELIFV
jgi:hypothetical protein